MSQSVNKTFSAADTAGGMMLLRPNEQASVTAASTGFTGSVVLQESFDGGHTWATVDTFTGDDSASYTNYSKKNVHIRCYCTARSGGTLACAINSVSTEILPNAVIKDGKVTSPNGVDVLTFREESVEVRALRAGTSGSTVSRTYEEISARRTLKAGQEASSHSAIYAQSLNANTTAQTATIAPITADFRRTVTASVTDTGSMRAFSSENTFTVSSGQTYTNSHASAGYSGILATLPTLSGSGALAITHAAAMYVPANSVNTGTNKYGVRVESITGATNNYSVYCGGGIMFNSGDLRVGATTVQSGYATEKQTLYSTQASAGASRYAGLASWHDISGTTAYTGSASASVSSIMRRNPGASVTDTGVISAGYFAASVNAGSGTYTNSNSLAGVSAIYVDNPSVTGTGAIANYAGIFVDESSQATGTNKYGIRVADQSGATNNYSIYTGVGDVRLGTATDKIGFLGADPVVKASHLADPTDESELVTWSAAVNVILENLGFVATS